MRSRFHRSSVRGSLAILTAVVLLNATQAKADVSCQMAVSQLQHYVAQVNAFANGEFYQGIPQRCAGVPICMQSWLTHLNGWYMQQTQLVGGWYNQIASQCTEERSAPRLETERQPRDEPPQIDEDQIEDLELDDEDRTVRIRIPNNPRGFRE